MRWLVLLIASVVLWSQGAHAACSNPVGVTGAVVYNTTHNVPQYCDASDNWIAMVGSEGSTSQGCPNIGDTCIDGSIYAGLHPTTDEKIYMAAADSPSGSWGVKDATGATSQTDGQSNQNWILNNRTISNYPVFNECHTETAHGRDDWYLPSVIEMDTLYSNLAVSPPGDDPDNPIDPATLSDGDGLTVPSSYDGPVSFSGDYVKSTQSTTQNKWLFRPGTGGRAQENNDKLNSNTVRCIRKESLNTTEVVPSGLVGHWRLDETSATEVVDSSGYGNVGTMQGGMNAATDTVSGKVKTALDFDGTDDRIDIMAATTIDNLGPLSITAWVKPESFVADVDSPILDKNAGVEGDGWTFYMADVTGFGNVLGFNIDTTSSAPNDYDRISLYPIPLDTWSHVAITWDGNISDETTAKLYINGSEVSAYLSFVDGVSGTNDNSGVDLNIGDGGYAGSGEFDGGIDDVRLYNRELSADEINNIFLAREGMRYNPSQRTMEYFDGNRFVSMRPSFPGVTKGLVGHWKLDEITFTSAADSSGNGNIGTLSGDLDQVNDSTTGAVGTGYVFDGVDDLVTIPYDADLVGNSETTISAWFRTDKTTGQQIVVMEDFSNLVLAIDGSGNVGFQAFTDGSGYNYTEANINYVADRWYHVVGVFADGQQGKIYVNGVDATSYADVAPTGSIRDQGVGFDIGYNSQGSNFPFFGAIDDVRIYNRSLTASEVQKLYNMGSPVGQTTSLPQGCPNIGDVCDDGTVYAGLSPDGNIAMFTTAQDVNEALYWNNGNNTSLVTTSLTDYDAGEGNTFALAQTDADSGVGGFQQHQAAQYCYDLVSNGADDWYLPAFNELSVLYAGRNEIGGFNQAPFIVYQTSNEVDSVRFRAVRFDTGGGYNIAKYSSGVPLRCVRKGPAPRCANPYGLEGAMVFNTTHNVVQYCDGARWIAIGKTGP
jgi:hypothetical protein